MSPNAAAMLGGAFSIVIGLLSCFFGYRFFRIVLALLGFVVGFGIGTALIASDQVVLEVIVGLIGGLIGAIIFYFLYVIGIIIAGAMLGGVVAQTLLLSLGVNDNTILLIGLVVGLIIGAFVAFVLNKWMIVVSTAFNGAAAILYGAALIFPGLLVFNPDNSIRLESPLVVIAWLLLGAIGAAYQISIYRNELRNP